MNVKAEEWPLGKHLAIQTEVIAQLKSMIHLQMIEEDTLIGKWRVVKTEIQSYSVEADILEFLSNGEFIWNLDGHVLRYIFEIDGTFMKYEVNGIWVIVRFIMDGDYLVMIPDHGRRSWLVRHP